VSHATVLVVNINPNATTRSGTRALIRKARALCAPGVSISERHYLRVNLEALRGAPPTAVVIGPQGVPFNAYPRMQKSTLFELLTSLTGPTLAVCGGHQALALAHGATIAPVFGGTAGPSYEGMKKERGFRKIRALQSDPILLELPENSTMFVSHVEEVKKLPLGFELLAQGDPCRIQLMRKGDEPIYGCQFHPEKGGDGDKLMRAFFLLAGIPLG
jgi:GMP synthase (glutamine-hydrolysing)